MKKTLTAAAIAMVFGLGAGTATQAAPVQTLGYSGSSVEVHQAGFKKFGHRGHFRNRGFGHRRFKHRGFRHGGFHHGRFLNRGFYRGDHGHNLRLKDGRLINKNGKKVYRDHGDYKGHHSRGVVVKKKVITPFGIFFK